MRTLLCIIMLGVSAAASALAESADACPPGFPADEVRHYEALHPYFNFAPYTKAQFVQQRTMPSGRVLRSRGTFEYRRGVGMMWRTEAPIRTAMIISANSMVLYGSQGQELRRTLLDGSPFAHYTTVFLNGVKPDKMDALTRMFRVTCRESGQTLTLGLQARRDGMDLRWLMVEVVGGNVSRVEFSSVRQGHTSIQFKDVINEQKTPDTPFRILER